MVSQSVQVKEERELFEDVISCPVEVRSVLVLSNPEIFFKQNINLPYSVIRIDKLKECIVGNKDRISDSDRMEILMKIDKYRAN